MLTFVFATLNAISLVIFSIFLIWPTANKILDKGVLRSSLTFLHLIFYWCFHKKISYIQYQKLRHTWEHFFKKVLSGMNITTVRFSWVSYLFFLGCFIDDGDPFTWRPEFESQTYFLYFCGMKENNLSYGRGARSAPFCVFISLK